MHHLVGKLTHPVWAEFPGVKQEDAGAGPGEELVTSYFGEQLF